MYAATRNPNISTDNTGTLGMGKPNVEGAQYCAPGANQGIFRLTGRV